MSLVGFDLALGHTVSVPLPGMGLDVEVASLAAIVVLKMTTWLDRPNERQRDLGDLAFVLEKFLDDFDERRWKEPLASLPASEQSAFYVGTLVQPPSSELAARPRRHRPRPRP